ARSGNTMRIVFRMTDATNGRLIHSQTLEQPWTELFALQDTLALRVAFSLRQRLGDEIALRLHRSATKSYAAWETFHLASNVTKSAIDADLLRGDPAAPSAFRQADSLYA